MKNLIGLFFVLSSLPAFSAAEVFLVEPMICTGVIQTRPRGMHESYSQVGLYFTSFKSTRTDRTLVNSLQVETQYASPNAKISTKHEDFGSEIWYMGPLYRDGKRVYRKSLSGREDDLNLKIEKERDSKAVVLKGTWTQKGTVVGDYVYKLSCTANVVDSVSRIDDNTAIKPKNAEAEMKNAKTVAECYEQDNQLGRRFKIGERGSSLKGFFKDYSSSTKEIEIFSCDKARDGNGFSCGRTAEVKIANVLRLVVTDAKVGLSSNNEKRVEFSTRTSGSDQVQTSSFICKKTSGF